MIVVYGSDDDRLNLVINCDTGAFLNDIQGWNMGEQLMGNTVDGGWMIDAKNPSVSVSVAI